MIFLLYISMCVGHNTCDAAEAYYYLIHKANNIMQNPYAPNLFPMDASDDDETVTKELFGNGLRCKALRLLEHSDLNEAGSDQNKRLLNLFLGSYSETLINFVRWMAKVPNRFFTNTRTGNDFSKTDKFRLLRYLGETNANRPIEDEDIFHEICSKKIDGKCFYQSGPTQFGKWISTASPLVIEFLFRSTRGFYYTKEDEFLTQIGTPEFVQLRRSYYFIDWLPTEQGVKWLRNRDQGYAWLMSKPTPTFLHSNLRREENVFNVCWLKSFMQLDKEFRNNYREESDGTFPFEYKHTQSMELQFEQRLVVT